MSYIAFGINCTPFIWRISARWPRPGPLRPISGAELRLGPFHLWIDIGPSLASWARKRATDEG